MASTTSSDELIAQQILHQSMKLPVKAQALLRMAVDQASDDLMQAAIRKLTKLSPEELHLMAQETGLSEEECKETIASLNGIPR